MKARNLFVIACVTLLAGSHVAMSLTLQDGLVAYYPLDGTANDASGNHNDGSVFGNVTLTSDRFGNPNSAYLFDGATGYIRVVGTSSVLNLSSALTLSAWVWHTPQDFNAQQIVNKYDAGNYSSGYSLASWWANPQGNSLELYDQANGQHLVADGFAPGSGSWELVTGTWDGATMSIYRNGVLEETSPFSGSIGTPSQDLYIGAVVSYGFLQQFFHGAIDDVRIYDRALSASEVFALTQLSTVPEPGFWGMFLPGLGVLLGFYASRHSRRPRANDVCPERSA